MPTIFLGIVEFVTAVGTLLWVREGRAARERKGRSWLSIARSAWGTDILREKSFVNLVISRLMFLAGVNALIGFFALYLTRVFGFTDSDKSLWVPVTQVIVAIVTVIATIPSARVSDRIGRKPVIYAACAIGGVGLVLAGLAPNLPVFMVAAAILGAAAGTFLAVDWALMTDIIPKAASGRYMGISNIAVASAGAVAGALVGPIIDIVGGQAQTGAGPRAAFIVGAAFFGLSAFFRPLPPDPARALSRAVSCPPMSDGTVMVIGGAEDKIRDRVILGRFVELAGGEQATIAVISTASSLGLEAGERYRAVFGELGVKHVRPLHAMTRAQANDETFARQLRDATGIFLTGGNQLRLSSTIGGTLLAEAVMERFRGGAVVGGTSAGASAMSTHMIAFGASGGTPKHRMAALAAGLGVLPSVIIDQHFQQRNRLGRLLSVIAQNPSLLGLGVDEDTAGIVGPDGIMEVIGRGSITIVDGAAAETDAWDIHGHRPLMISGVVLHALPAGYRFDLRRRHRVSAPSLKALQGGEAAASS